MTKQQEYLIKSGTLSADLQAGSGYLNPEQATAFLREVFDSTPLLTAIRRITMAGPQKEISKIFVGSRVMRGVDKANEIEDQSPYIRKATFEKLQLLTNKYSLPWSVSEDSLEDNIEGKTFETTLAQMFAAQMGLDLEDLAINGNDLSASLPTATTLNGGIDATVTQLTATAGATYPILGSAGFLVIDAAGIREDVLYEYRSGNVFYNLQRGQNGTAAAAHLTTVTIAFLADALTGTDDGWIKLMETGGGNLVDGSAINSGDLDKNHFFSALNAMPTNYKRGQKGGLRWVMSMQQFENWQSYLSQRTSNAGYDILAGKEGNPLGIPAITPGSWPNRVIALTNAKNLILGVQRNIRIRKATQDKTSIMTDQRFYNATVRLDMEVERADATVLLQNLTGN